MLWSEHIFIKRLFTSLALLFDFSLRGVNSENEILFLSDFSESARFVISITIWMDLLSKFRSLVAQCNTMWSGLKSRTAGFAWSSMHITLTELIYRPLRYLGFSFRVSKKLFNFFIMLYNFFWGWWRRCVINFIISTTFIVIIVFIFIIVIITITIIIIAAVVFVLLFFIDFLFLKVILKSLVLSITVTLPLLFLEKKISYQKTFYYYCYDCH